MNKRHSLKMRRFRLPPKCRASSKLFATLRKRSKYSRGSAFHKKLVGWRTRARRTIARRRLLAGAIRDWAKIPPGRQKILVQLFTRIAVELNAKRRY